MREYIIVAKIEKYKPDRVRKIVIAMINRIKCLFMGHFYKVVIRKDLQGGSFYSCVKCGRINSHGVGGVGMGGSGR